MRRRRCWTRAPPDEAFLTDLLNDLSDLPRDLLLVLDDYHLVEAHGVHDGLAFVLDHRPPQLHVVLATRTDPPLGLARLRARGELVEVRTADLRFTAEESAAYLNDSMGLSLAEGDVEALDARTEGWIAALQLAALSMHGREDVSGFIAGFAGDDRYVVDYLAEEVLARQPAEVRDFLLQTSLLERLTGPLCEAVTGRPGGTAMLTALDRANLFLVALDDRRQWYRYHHLFADVLRAHLGEEQGADVAELHRRASVWFADHEQPAEAVEHAVAAQDFARAADLAELAYRELARTRQESVLRDWVRLLPDDVVRTRPVLGVYLVGALAQVSDFDSIPGRLDAIDDLLRPGREHGIGSPWPAEPPPGAVVVDVEGFRGLPAQVEMYRAALALAAGDADGTVAHAQEARQLAQPDDHLARAASAALAGLALWSVGDLAGAHDGYLQAVVGLQRAGHVADVLGCSVTIGDLRATQGSLDGALAAYEQALELAAAEPGAPLRGTADMHVGIAAVLLERDDVDGAAQHLATSHQLGESKGLPQNPYRWRLVSARLRAAPGRPRHRPRPARRGRPGLQRRLLTTGPAGTRRASPAPDPARRAHPRGRLGGGAAAQRSRRAVVPAGVRARHTRPAAPRAARRGRRPRRPRAGDHVAGPPARGGRPRWSDRQRRSRCSSSSPGRTPLGATPWRHGRR